MAGDRVVFWVAIAFLAWWVVGTQWNRRRARALVAALRDEVPRLGTQVTVRALGSGAFRVDVAAPRDGLEAVSMICLLEPRDFPLAWLWGRLRGHRDRVILEARLRQPPAQVLRLSGRDPAAADLGLRRLIELRLDREPARLRLAFSVSARDERTELARAFDLVRQHAGGA